ncbi:hypothetical protein MMC07_003589 [Pseudocyphellaria aurata]|nr:hypothetical protein [Pseudocyphellaria aurata]
MEFNAVILDEPDGMDDATAALILELQNQDIEELSHARKGKGRHGEESDADLAVAAYQQELQHSTTILADRRMCRSLAQAVICDAAILHESRVQEDTAVRDRVLARSLDTRGAPPVTQNQVSAEDVLDDGFIARLTTLYISHRDEDVPQDGNSAAAESSAWAESRRKPSAVALRRCSICYSEKPLFEIFRTPCGHDYCQECLSTLFQLATTDETLFPPRCCRQQIPLQLAKLYLSSALIRTFEEKSIEFKSPNRTYCSQPTCSTFISPENIEGDRATCPTCGTRTCTICKNDAHRGDCPEDTATQQILETGLENGWQRCYNCRRLVELDHGSVPVAHNFIMFADNPGGRVLVPSGMRIASPPVRTKSSPAIPLGSV